MSHKGLIIVYVQALPVSIQNSARKFQHLDSSEFQMSHSSKKALSIASSLGYHEIIAVGFSPILREAIVRGATRAKTVPLCDDPLEQSSFFPRDDSIDQVIVGENPDWVFTGASLCGVLAQTCKKRLQIIDEGSMADTSTGSIILVRDGGESSQSVDIRRVKYASEISIDREVVLGSANLLKRESRKNEIISGEPREIASIISRRLKRISK